MNRPTALFAALCLCAGAAAQADSLRAAQAATPSAQSSPRWTLARQKPGGSGVVVRYATPASTRLGQAAVVRLELSGITTGARVELRSTPADLQLEIVGASAPGPLELHAGEVRTLEVRVLAAAEGLHYLNVFTTQAGRPGVAAVPVRVGSASVQLKPGGTVQTTPSGERIISLPASR